MAASGGPSSEAKTKLGAPDKLKKKTEECAMEADDNEIHSALDGGIALPASSSGEGCPQRRRGLAALAIVTHHGGSRRGHRALKR